MQSVDDFWSNIPGPELLDSEANVELRLVLPLLQALGYRNEDIDAKKAVYFQQGRTVGRKPEADFVCYHGLLHDRNNSLLVVEAKAATEPLPAGKGQGESYAQNLRVPLLLLTNGRDFEIWQLQLSSDSECVLRVSVDDLAAHRGEIEGFLNKEAVYAYCGKLKFKTIAEASSDFGDYETAELRRSKAGPVAISRTVLADDGRGRQDVASTTLLNAYPNGAVVTGPSGYGKTTLSRDLFSQAIEDRWRGHHQKIAIEAPFPDLEQSGAGLLKFTMDRLNAHHPGVTEESLKAVLRKTGLTILCDSLDRTSSAFQKRIAAEIGLLLRDYPLIQIFVFARADNAPAIVLPVLELAPLSPAQVRELEKALFPDGTADHWSIIGSAPPTLEALCNNPLLLRLALEYWKEHRDFPREIEVLFRSWLDSVLETEPGDPISRARRENALSLIAQETAIRPMTVGLALALIKQNDIPEQVLNDLIQCSAVHELNSGLEVQHDALADYLRAKAFAARPVATQLEDIPNLTLPPGSFLPVLLMSQLQDRGAQGALWLHLAGGPVDTYLDALRYRLDGSDELKRMGRDELSVLYMTDLLNGIEEPLDGFFPVLRPAVTEWLTDAVNKPLGIIGAANPYALQYKIHAREPGEARVVVGAPDFPGTIRGVKLEGRLRLDSARLLGMNLLASSLEHVIKDQAMPGGRAWANERLVGRVRFLAQRYDLPVSVDQSLDELERVIRPLAGEAIKEGPFVGRERFTFASLLEDIEKLQSAGKTSLDPWWQRLGWKGDVSDVTDDALARILNEEYQRVQLVYSEIVEKAFARHTKDLIWYPILPLRWDLKVARRGPMNRTFVIFPRWKPVKNWEDAGADVTFVERGKHGGLPLWEEVRNALIALGRPTNLPHLGGFTTHGGYDGSHLTSYFNGATPVTNEVLSWLEEERRGLFQNLPRGDGAFAV